MYHFTVHLLYASIVGCAAWVLTSIRAASATTKFWIWVVTALNFVVPSGALIDVLWAPHVTWSEPFRALVGLVRYMTQGRTALLVPVIWTTGALAMLARLILRWRKDRREVQVPANGHDVTFSFMADDIPVSFDSRHPTPVVGGLLYPRILLPAGIDYSTDRS